MVEKAAEELTDTEIQAYVDELKSKYPVVGVTDEGLYCAARVSMATAKAAIDRGVSVMAVEDFNTVVMDHFKTRPQLWVPGLRERGMVASMEGDVIAAEPGALIGFAGQRVIEQTTGQKLPEGFQRAEFQLEHGFVDLLISRKEASKTIANLIALHTRRV
jgi:hypothetical protein